MNWPMLALLETTAIYVFNGQVFILAAAITFNMILIVQTVAPAVIIYIGNE
jgi:hypothetical protein